MDNFLQLVPMEADADDSDSALVYGEEDDLVHETDAAAADGSDSAAHFFAPFVAAPSVSPPPPVASSEQQRARFLELLETIERSAEAAQAALAKRLDAVLAIRQMDGDVASQLAAYVPLLRPQEDHHDVHNDDDVAAELLACARDMGDPRDAEVALAAAFVFLTDATRRRRRPIAAPAAAVLSDELSNVHTLLTDNTAGI